jgi:two-component system sensor histidine kinase EvgS
MDGYQAAKAIKDFTNIPIIALTASVLTEEFERIKSHNFQGYLRKPILKKDLMNELSRFLPFTEDIENDVLDNQSKIAFLSVEELSYLPQLLIQLKSLLPHCQEISVSNNISEIKRFANVVLATKQHYPVASVIDYSNSLSRYIDCFDIVSIKQTLNEYPRLISQLEKQISYLPSNENDLRLDLKR